MVDDLMKYGEVHRGTIGGIVTIDHLTPQAAEELGVSSTTGAVVTRMQRGTPAYDVGIRPGDVIVRFNNTAIDDPSQLYRLVADARIGSEATIRVLRGGRSMDFKVPITSDARTRR
jgi:S1-C subfamily serine protease